MIVYVNGGLVKWSGETSKCVFNTAFHAVQRCPALIEDFPSSTNYGLHICTTYAGKSIGSKVLLVVDKIPEPLWCPPPIKLNVYIV